MEKTAGGHEVLQHRNYSVLFAVDSLTAAASGLSFGLLGSSFELGRNELCVYHSDRELKWPGVAENWSSSDRPLDVIKQMLEVNGEDIAIQLSGS